mmetsp:Transcript_19326/g.74117  ORF Transcript_19326/g.74117 Transcript_19326/m.74117 type:complete len:206 (-) Transcript_19326:905-1522(-)
MAASRRASSAASSAAAVDDTIAAPAAADLARRALRDPSSRASQASACARSCSSKTADCEPTCTSSVVHWDISDSPALAKSVVSSSPESFLAASVLTRDPTSSRNWPRAASSVASTGSPASVRVSSRACSAAVVWKPGRTFSQKSAAWTSTPAPSPPTAKLFLVTLLWKPVPRSISTVRVLRWSKSSMVICVNSSARWSPSVDMAP